MKKTLLPLIIFILVLVADINTTYSQIEQAEEVDPLLVYIINGYDMYRNNISNIDISTLSNIHDSCETFRTHVDADPGARGRLNNYYQKSLYLSGWCHFRMAELSGNRDYLDIAHRWFVEVERTAVDSLGYMAVYMAGECKLQKAILTKFSRLVESPNGLSDVSDIESELESARAAFQNLSGNNIPQPFKLYASLQLKKIEYENIKLIQSSPRDEDIDLLLSNIDYRGLLNTLDSNSNNQGESFAAGSILPYWEAIGNLELIYNNRKNGTANNYFLNHQNDLLDESGYRLANRDMVIGNYTNAMNFHETNPTLPEQYYWAGFLRLSQSDWQRSRDRFNTFLSRVNTGFIRDRYKPLSGSSRRNKTILNLALGDNLSSNDWDYINDSLSTRDYFFIVMVSAAIPGSHRQSCLNILDQIRTTVLTDNTDEHFFISGLIHSLRGDVNNDIAGYDGCISEMSQISTKSKYNGEARYIIGRSKFMKARLTTDTIQKSVLIKEAKTIFDNLVSNKGSIRALYYLGLVHLFLDHKNAGKACFDTIVSLDPNCRDQSETYFHWKQSAIDAIKLRVPQALDNGDKVIIAGINSIKCEDTLSIVPILTDRDLVQYERLTEERIIKEEFVRQSLADMKLFDLPPKMISPIIPSRLLDSNRIYENVFQATVAPVTDEIDLDINWTLKVCFYGVDTNDVARQISSDNIKCRTRCNQNSNDKILTPIESYYKLEKISISDTVIINIEADGFYPMQFFFSSTQSGTIEKNVLLHRQQVYSVSKEAKPAHKPNLNLKRCDYSPRYRSLLSKIDKDSDLGKAILDISFRDCAMDRKEQFIYAIDADDIAPIQYSANDFSQLGRISIDSSGRELKLDSPESIDIDSDGNILIADLGNNRIIKLNENFQFDLEISNKSSDQFGSLVFPSTIYVARDTVGIKVDAANATLYYQDIYYIVDYIGIHKFDNGGNYLDSPYLFDNTKLDSVTYNIGSLYSLDIIRNNHQQKIYILNRTDNNKSLIIMSSHK